MSYTARIYTGDYTERQRAANADGCICYAEQHFNAAEASSADYSLAIVASNASLTSKKWGKLYAKKIDEAFTEVSKPGGTVGILVGGYRGRGDGNIRHTSMPAILCEPLFLTNIQHQRIINSETGQTKMAEILVETIKEMFPNGGLVGLSIGHIGKTSNPTDKGSYAPGVGYEGDFAKEVILKTARILNRETECT